MHVVAQLAVERGERLVEQQHARLADEGPRERDPLGLAAGELVHPLTEAVAWLARTVRRVGPATLLRHRVRPVNFVMHQFMDAEDVTPAWEATQRGETLADPHLRSVQERLQACHYARWRTPRTAPSSRRACSRPCSTRWETPRFASGPAGCSPSASGNPCY